LPAAEARNSGSAETPHITHTRVVNGPIVGHRDAFREARVVVFYGAINVSVESVRELLNKVSCATHLSGFADLVIILCEAGVAKSNVLAYLSMLRYITLLKFVNIRLTERGKFV
jgi:hypothetical protein